MQGPDQDSRPDHDPVINWLLFGIIGLSVIAMLFGAPVIYFRFFGRHHHTGGTLTACKSNLKNIGTAMEMYSTDYTGHYPSSMSELVPNYLRTLPECPSAKSMTYYAYLGPNAPMNSEAYDDYYYIECHGGNHTAVSVTGDYPAYNAVEGLIERAPLPVPVVPSPAASPVLGL